MKYDSNTKRKRNEQIVRYREANPDLSLREIGQIFGITSQRVSAIVLREQRKRTSTQTN